MKAGWEVKALSEITTKIGSGATPRGGAAAYKTKGMSLIRSLNVHDLWFKEKNLALIDDVQADALSNVIVQSGDVLLNITGASIARCCTVPDSKLPARVNQHVSILRPDTKMVSSSYLSYLLTSKEQKDKLLGIGDEAGATRQALTKSHLKAFRILLPPLEEQRRIVAVLDGAFEGLDRARTYIQTNLQNARELFESQVNAIFQTAKSKHDMLPIGELAERITKGSSPKWQGVDYVETPGVLFVTSENVGTNQILLKKTKYVDEVFNVKDKKSILQRGDVLTNIVGASIGRTAVYELDEVANINQAVCLIRCLPAVLTNYYLCYLLNSPFFKQMLHEAEVDNARANLSLTFFRNFRVPVPPLAEQLEIVSSIDLVRSDAERLEAQYITKLQDLDDLRQSLLQKAFAGELT